MTYKFKSAITRGGLLTPNLIEIKGRRTSRISARNFVKRDTKTTKQILLTCLMLISVIITQGQTTAATSGGEAFGSGGKVSFSVGQVANQTHSGTNGGVSEGVQQPFEISVVTGIAEAIGINLSVLAYPNPTTDYLTLEVKNCDLSKLNFQLYDMSGKLLQSKILNKKQTQIDMSNYISSTYFVKVIKENQSIKEFKIIKN